MDQLTLQQKSELRVKSLMVAKDIYYASSATQILKEAESIYAWLTQESSTKEAESHQKLIELIKKGLITPQQLL